MGMGILDKIGLGRKKPRPVGQSLEKGRDNARRQRQRNLAVKAGIILALVLMTLAAFPRGDVYRYTVQVGDEWRRETLEAPFDFAIYKEPAVLAEERRQVRSTTPPYFRENVDARRRVTAYRDTLASQLERVFDAYASYQFHRLRGHPVEASEDSVRYVELRRNVRLKATPEQWTMLASAYTNRMPGLSSTSREPQVGPRLDEALLSRAYDVAMLLLERGVMDVPSDSVLTDQVFVRNEMEHVERAEEKNALLGLNEAYLAAEAIFEEYYGTNSPHANLGSAFFRAIFTPSLSYQRAATLQEWQRKEARISPTQGKISAGEVIVREGQQITDEVKRKLTSLERSQRERGGDTILWRILLGQFLVALATYVIFFLYLFLLRRQIFDDNRYVMLLALLFGGIIGLFAISIRLPSVAMYAVPVAIAPVLLTVMFDSRVGLFGGLTLALIGGQLLDFDFEFTFATIFATTLGVFSVRDIKNRGQFFVSAGLVFAGYLVVLGATAVLYSMPRERFLSDLLLVGVNSFLLILAYPLLWVFERAFDITTDLSLLELSDTNRPLLKELSLRAPGTFNHSLQVANLAEAAADAIGANALLARVGALYHDIGKMLKPEYFVENQRPADNPHNQLKPRMSALIIASHVKEGLEMGRQYNLPKRVLDFIPMHHGTTRIEYFYRKALELQKESDPPVLESEFRYPGPRPDARETGILMLADSVEAASRSLSDPTHKRLETLIDMIFKARIEDGQLDSSDLTFRDLSQIKETFLAMLLGIYHVRVRYPGQEEEERVPTASRAGAPAAGATAPVVTERVPPKAVRAERPEGVAGTPEQSAPLDPDAELPGPLSIPDAPGDGDRPAQEAADAAAPEGGGREERSGPETPGEDDDEDAELRPDRNGLIGDPSRRAAGPGDGSDGDVAAERPSGDTPA